MIAFPESWIGVPDLNGNAWTRLEWEYANALVLRRSRVCVFAALLNAPYRGRDAFAVIRTLTARPECLLRPAQRAVETRTARGP